MIQKAFGDESMGKTQIKEWYRRFKNGRTSVDSDPRSGRPSLTTTPENIEFAPRGQTINKEYYVEVLKRLRDAVRRKRPRFWSSGDWLLHHDNAPAHSSNLVQQFLARHKIKQLRQPPYSPDIAPCDYWMFPKLKMALKGKRFDDIETIQSNATRELKAIPKPAFENCFKMWKHRWERVVQSNGDYFEGCHGPDDE